MPNITSKITHTNVRVAGINFFLRLYHKLSSRIFICVKRLFYYRIIHAEGTIFSQNSDEKIRNLNF
jgi:hypothetical protein